MGDPEMLARTVAPASAASWLGGTGTHRSSHTSTCSDEARHVGGAEEQVGAEGHPVAGDLDRLAALVVAGGEVAPLVELAVGRQVGLRGDAEDARRRG